ncbi:hypothetical protein M422DRAFT_151476, partial [Sphaerobolus stellatus SS14]
CCCRRLLFTQPDFCSQKPQLQHCELNFIEQYWGSAKFYYRSSPRTTDIDEMERNMLQCLDSVPLLHIQRYANRSARFIFAYSEGLTGTQAVWANKKFHGHRVLPPSMIAEIKKSVLEA